MANTLAHGARVWLYLNSLKLGRARSFEFSPNIQYKEIKCIDTTEALELAVTGTSISGSIGVLRTPGDGGLEGLAASAFFQHAVLQKYNVIRLQDRVTRLDLARIERVVIGGQNWSVAAKELMSGRLSFTGILHASEHPRGPA